MNSALICRTAIQAALLAAGIGVVWMMGSPSFRFDPETKQQIILLLGTLAAAAGAATRGKEPDA